MHADIAELLAAEDGGVLDATLLEHLERCPHCRAERHRIRDLRARLTALPVSAPPVDAWTQIRLRAAATRPRIARNWRWAGGLALAASLVAIALVFGHERLAEPTPESLPSASIASLMRQSRQLEIALQQLGGQDNVTLVSTAATVAALEDRIALVDYELNQDTARSNVTGQARLWQTRVDLMRSLVAVRYAQTVAQL